MHEHVLKMIEEAWGPVSGCWAVQRRLRGGAIGSEVPVRGGEGRGDGSGGGVGGGPLGSGAGAARHTQNGNSRYEPTTFQPKSLGLTTNLLSYLQLILM
mgnify:CR=1 FL=1